MAIFYKYTSFERGRYILRNRCLPLGHISNYNDPYECAIDGFDEEVMSFIGHMSDEQKKEWLMYVINKTADKENWSKEKRDAGMSAIAMYGAKTLATLNPFTALLLMGGVCAFSAIAGSGDNRSKLKPEHVDKYMRKLIPCLENTYTSCMSTCYNNFLTWSHYADSHKGMVIGFDANAESFASNTPAPMDYKDERFAFDAGMLMACDVKKDIKALLLRKSKKWEYEEECRFIFGTHNNANKIIWYDHYDNPIIKLGDNAVKSVYFGTRVPIERIDQIKSILSSQGGLGPIELFQCKLCDSGYELRFPKIE